MNLKTLKICQVYKIASILFIMFCFLQNAISLDIKTVYIDPTYTGTQLGTISQPYISIPTPFENNTKYLFKGGTTFSTTTDYQYGVDNCTIGSYEGVAIIESNVVGRCFLLDGNNNTIENLHIKALNNFGGASNGSIIVEFKINGGKCTFRNLNLEGGWRGMVAGNYSGGTGILIIDSCKLHSTQSDGVYIDDLDSAIITNTEVWDVNINYKNDYGGDAVQMESVIYPVVKNCFFDHSQAPGKYALILNGYITADVSNSTIKSYDGEACAYLGDNKDDNKTTGRRARGAADA